ncbi:CopL family metal-binding regulatory protein [Novilysobacter avium]|uniref:CopL family metal-binding regulatory protein n=1 Tax=Novilysobacter avium TaxID=2781023 RepID=A0A7S6ZTP2_9GAMM|nr:CopL family metal-binding regulatory protein [Lysobacter avium]
MPIPHLLLRVLLCLALVLNGSGLAVAATQMHVQHVGMADAVSATDDHEDCAGHAQRAVPDLAAASCDSHSPAADCCEGSSCDTACPAGMLWTVTVPAQAWMLPPQVLVDHQTISDHAAPVLQGRYRPPIG